MSPLNELIESANKLCNSLELIAYNDKKFSDNVLVELERLSWETRKITYDLRVIKEYIS